jgi:5-methylcytosine-specific restriction endonuclease McrA
LAELSLPESIVTRQSAKALGLKRYSPGSACPQGHIAERYTINGRCCTCSAIAEAKAYRDDPGKAKRSAERDPDHKKKRAARARRWRAKNPEKRREADKRQREKHHDKVLERTRSWRERNKDHVKQYIKRYDYHNRNREKASARTCRWAKENPEKHLANCHKRRARVLGAEGFYTPEDIQKILADQNGLCVGINCGKDISKRFTIDHIIPLVRGGSNWPANLQLTCKSCNCKKGKRTMEEWRASMLSLA